MIRKYKFKDGEILIDTNLTRKAKDEYNSSSSSVLILISSIPVITQDSNESTKEDKNENS